MFCYDDGVAYQDGLEVAVAYDAAYFAKCASYDRAIAQRVNAARCALVARHYQGRVLDVGAGAGQFVAARPDTFGFDVNPATVAQLERVGLYADNFEAFNAFTFWDVLEHVPAPQDYFDRIGVGAYVFVSIPIVRSLYGLRASKHYRPGEHLYYFTWGGFLCWARTYGFRLLECNADEVAAGREGIQSFAFVRESR